MGFGYGSCVDGCPQDMITQCVWTAPSSSSSSSSLPFQPYFATLGGILRFFIFSFWAVGREGGGGTMFFFPVLTGACCPPD